MRAFAEDETSREAECYERVQALLNTPSAHEQASVAARRTFSMGSRESLVLSSGYKFNHVIEEKSFARVFSF